jgi:hypothetical protein
MFARGVICVVMIGYIIGHYCLRFARGVICVAVIGYIIAITV